MNATVGPCTVRIYGGMGPEGEEFKMIKLTNLGDDIKMYQWVQGEKFTEFDRFTGCKIQENPDGFTIMGTSTRMVDEIGLDKEDSQVRLEVDFQGCESCR